jgi:nucleotide-binding universal stress UspA family protein
VFDHILIALDGSDEAAAAGALGLRVARHMSARVTGLSVIDVRVVEGPAVETLAPLWGEVTGRPFQPELMRLYRERATSALDDFCSAAERIGLGQIERCAEIGVAEDAVLDRAAKADLLVMGRRGEHAGFGRHALGSTVSRVLHRARCPVLVAADVAGFEARANHLSEESDVPRRPLVAWEPGPGAAGALELALRYCHTVGAQLRLVHAGDGSHDTCLDEAHALLADASVSWESARIAAHPADAVAEALRRWDSDCLFMGAFGRGRLRDFLFGSNTVEILERSAVPVFVFR